MTEAEECRNILKCFMREYTHIGYEWFINETLDLKKMLVYEKLAGMVDKARQNYLIALELEREEERDAAHATPAAIRSAACQPKPVV